MHDAAFIWVRRMAQALPPLLSVLEFGSRAVNGTVREIFTDAVDYVGVDLEAGDNVTVVGNAADVSLGKQFDCVVCCETLEHTPDGAEIAANAFRHLRRGGVFIVTCANNQRVPHSCDGGPLMPEEYYGGVGAEQMKGWLREARFPFALVEEFGTDTYAFAIRW